METRDSVGRHGRTRQVDVVTVLVATGVGATTGAFTGLREGAVLLLASGLVCLSLRARSPLGTRRGAAARRRGPAPVTGS